MFPDSTKKQRQILTTIFKNYKPLNRTDTHYFEQEQVGHADCVHKNNNTSSRMCLICGSTTTALGSAKTKSGKKYPRWHRYKNGYACNKCKFRIRYAETKERGNQFIWITV